MAPHAPAHTGTRTECHALVLWCDSSSCTTDLLKSDWTSVPSLPVILLGAVSTGRLEGLREFHQLFVSLFHAAVRDGRRRVRCDELLREMTRHARD